MKDKNLRKLTESRKEDTKKLKKPKLLQEIETKEERGDG